jgi:hypothetical protein
MKIKMILAILIAAYFSQAHADMGTGLTSDIAMSKKWDKGEQEDAYKSRSLENI